MSTTPFARGAETATFSSNFRDTELRDQEGHRFSPAQLAGKVVLFNFIYTGCSTVCPLQTHALAQMRLALPADVRRGVHFVSISLDPLNDTPALLKAYAKRMGADLEGWSFVTGRPQDIERVAGQLRLRSGESGTSLPSDHSSALWLIDRQGRLLQRYSGNPPDAARLSREIEQLFAARL